ncbi:MAG TPA: tRNA1(Val) (adenine(37)-N6)-methyltransferase [Thermoanaerobacterales bacterium]|nr:tRNA1(Val) (adenine(37)-N6)-methyltransferase [Thermoanaerobacterales bacterium]
MDKFLKYPGERIDDLLCNGLKIIQHKNSYRFAIDAVLLANFVKAGKKDKIIDLGTGSGVIALLISAKTDAEEIVGIEIAQGAFDRAVRSIKMNRLQERVKIIHGNLKEAVNIFGRESFSVVVTNPPYMTVKEGKISPNPDLAIARHEVAAALQDVVKAARGLLTFSGRFYMVYRTVRLTDAIYEMKLQGLEPKILRFIHPRAGDSPNLFLLMAQKGAGPGLKILPPLVVYNNDGSYTDEIKEIYFGKQSEV